MDRKTLDVQQKSGNDDAERQRTADQIHGYIETQSSQQRTFSEDAYEKSQGNTSAVNEEVRKNAQKDAADMKKAGFNNQEIVDVQREVLEQTGLNAQASANQSANVVQAIDQLERRLMGEESERTGNSSKNELVVKDLRDEVNTQLEDIDEKETKEARGQRRALEDQRIKVGEQARTARIEQESNTLELNDIRRETLRQKEENARKRPV